LHSEMPTDTRATWTGWLRQQQPPGGRAKRARALWLWADGDACAATARQVALRERQVRQWARRFARQGLDGLLDNTRPGRRPVFSPRSGAGGRANGVGASRGRWAVPGALGEGRTGPTVGA